VANFHTISIPATILASTAVAIILLARIITPRIPGSIIVLFGGTAAAILFRLPLDTIGTRFGEIPAALPHMSS
jgi:SulP family sulfate permease